MKDDVTLLSLVGEVYDAAMDEAKWAPLAPRIAAVLEADSAVVQARGLARGGVDLLTVSENFTPRLMGEYVEHYHALDEWANRAMPLVPDVARLGDELMSFTELRNSEFCEWLRRLDVFHLVGAVITVDGDSAGILGVHRKSRPFDEKGKRRVDLLIPHLRRALQVRNTFLKQRLQRDAALEGLDRLATAALLLDGEARVLFANRAAEALLSEGDGLAVAHGRLVGRAPKATEWLRALVAEAARTAAARSAHPGGSLPLPRRDRRPLTVLVSPMRGEAFGIDALAGLALVLVRDPVGHKASSVAALQTLFRLTPAEARLAAALTDGSSLEEIAAANGSSIHTARTLLKRVLGKTATRRQGELIALILNSTAALSDHARFD
jgi:DNA-binding CsgD family transcriptional regulator